MNFKTYLREETTSADIATVDNRLDRKTDASAKKLKNKRCKAHKRNNCDECLTDKWN
jgi:hypothetical protein